MALDRQEVLDLVVGMLDELRGSRELNLREIARRLGCAHTSLYNHFPSFEGLLADAASLAILRMRSELLPPDDSTPMPERLAAFAGRLFDYVERHQGLYVFLWLESRPGDQASRFGGNSRPESLFEPALVGFLGKKRTTLEIRDIAALLHSYFHGEATKFVCGATNDSPRVVRERIQRNTRRILEALR